MNKRKYDFLWCLIILLWVLVLIIPVSRIKFIETTEVYPYLGGFFKFSILATMGDLLGGRILKNEWTVPKGFIYKAIVWGLLGMMITLVFKIFTGGAAIAQSSGLLPFNGSILAQAFFGSLIMNVTFGPMMYIYHKFADLYIDAIYDKKAGRITSITLEYLVKQVDWYTIVSFSWLKTCTCIWIPLHTLVFLIPSEYRVLASAFLSILLGILVALSKKNSKSIKTAA